MVGGHGSVKQLLEATTSEDDAVRNSMAGWLANSATQLTIMRHVDTIRVARHPKFRHENSYEAHSSLQPRNPSGSNFTINTWILITTLDMLGHNRCWIMGGES
jgi:hypothetical protein